MHGVKVFQSSIDYVQYIISNGIKTAIVSSSANSRTVLESADILDLFPVIVDGVTAKEIKLSGKPSPDMFLEAAKQLGVQPEKCVVVEDAISGVQAGRNGKFGLVIGIARKNNGDIIIVFI